MRRTRLRPVSAKRRRERADRVAQIGDLQADGRRFCEIGPTLSFASMDDRHTPAECRVLSDAALACTRFVQGLHERRKQSAAGSRTHPANLIPACNRCNGWVEDWPDLAHSLGLVVRPGDAEWHALAADPVKSLGPPRSVPG